MALSLYEASVPVLLRGLERLSAILAKAEAHALSQGLDVIALTALRLAPDMLDLRKQVQIASDTAKGCAARLAGLTPPSFPDDEVSFAELQARIARTGDYLRGVPAEEIASADGRTVSLKIGGHSLTFTARDYLFQFVLPNFFFHVTTAYGILRREGVPLGKRDYLGG